MIELRSVSLLRARRPVLDRVSVRFAAGCLTVILGPNGAGKSTLLKIASGELRPSSGEALIAGAPLASVSPLRLAALRAVVAQSNALSFPFSVAEVVALGRSVPGFGRDADARAADAALAAVGLASLAERCYTELSGGERQRVHIARALCQIDAAPDASASPQALLLDEPTASLDPAHQALVMGLLRDRADRGGAIAVVMHDLNLAAAWADRVVLVGDGRVLADGTPLAVMTEERLSAAYGCPMGVNALPPEGQVYVLPPARRAGNLESLQTVGQPHARHAIETTGASSRAGLLG